MALGRLCNSLHLDFLRPSALPRISTFQRFLTTSKTPDPSASTVASESELAQVEISPSSPLPYRILRTPSNQLPIYLLAKRGGNLKQTRLRKIEGNISLLRTHLQQALGLEQKDVAVNQLTRHIIIKGWRKGEVERFLKNRHF